MSGKPTTYDPETRALVVVIIRTLIYVIKWLRRHYDIKE